MKRKDLELILDDKSNDREIIELAEKDLGEMKIKKKIMKTN